jgi:hypothetical protein
VAGSRVADDVRMRLKRSPLNAVLAGVSALAFAVSVGCTADSTEDTAAATDTADVIGVASNVDAIVVVADSDDRFACSGALVRPDVVMVNSGCLRRASAVYVGFSAPVAASSPLGPAAGGATRIALRGEPLQLKGVRTAPHVGFAALQTPAAASIPLGKAVPSVGDTCEIVGHGPPQKGSDERGVQRAATVELIRSTSTEVDAREATGKDTVVWGDFSAFLVCAGQLVGPKAHNATPLSAAAVLFNSFARPESVVIDAIVAGLAEAGTSTDAGPLVEAGTPCAAASSFSARACGFCGTQYAACAASSGGQLAWTDYDVCTGENKCAPGDVRTSTLGCAAGTQRTQTCRPWCDWSYAKCE